MQLLWKTKKFLRNLKIESLFEPAIPLLAIYTKELKKGSSGDIFTPVFIVALFTIAKMWKQSECPSMVKWKCGI